MRYQAAVTLAETFARFDDHVSPKLVGAVNDACAEVVEAQGDGCLVSHAHAQEFGFVLVIAGLARGATRAVGAKRNDAHRRC